MNLIHSFKTNREDADDYIKTIETMFFAFIKTEEFVSMPASKRTTMVDCVVEIKSLIQNIFDEKENSPQSDRTHENPDSERDSGSVKIEQTDGSVKKEPNSEEMLP